MEEGAPDADQLENWLGQQFPSSQNYREGRAKYIQNGQKLLKPIDSLLQPSSGGQPNSCDGSNDDLA
jgi:hypothetical protein